MVVPNNKEIKCFGDSSSFLNGEVSFGYQMLILKPFQISFKSNVKEAFEDCG